VAFYHKPNKSAPTEKYMVYTISRPESQISCGTSSSLLNINIVPVCKKNIYLQTHKIFSAFPDLINRFDTI